MRLDFEAKMASSRDATSRREQLQGLVPSCVPTLSLGTYIFLFLEQIAPPWRHKSVRIHEHVVDSRVGVVTLCDQMERIARFSCGFFTAIAWNKAGNKYQMETFWFFRLRLRL